MIIDWLEEWFKGVLIDGIIGNLSGLFDTVNTKVGEIAADVGATPQGLDSGIFNMIRNLSENPSLPDCGCNSCICNDLRADPDGDREK